MTFPVDRLTLALERLRKKDPAGKKTFGASSHRYLLHPVVPEKTLAAFEKKHGIVLPADYRDFLRLVGDGGAGPYYGVFRLGEMDDNYEHAKWKARSHFVGAPEEPFPHRSAWNLSEEELEEIQGSEDDEAIMARYWKPVNGAIPICHEGCALRDWLVVTGPEAGRIWHDATADYEGWKPITDPSGEHSTFLSWYLRWLDRALVDAKLA